ncbi:MAG: TonB-dependent receptor plug domain-containing protein [Longimicrobiales bacterium]
MRTALTLSLLLTLGLAAPAVAQVRIVGRVIDDTTERPLAGAQVTVRGTDGRHLVRVETEETGTFEFEVNRVSAVRIDIRRMSYRANSMPILHFDGRKFFQVEARLAPDAILLAPLEVIAWSEVDMSPFLEGFRQRLRGGLGLYITREQIEARRPTYVADLLREVPGVVVTGSGTGARASVQVGRSAASRCQTQIFVDGFLMNRRTSLGLGLVEDFRIDDAVTPISVEGIEVYRGLSSVPAEFLNPDAECGVIAIWTRRGGTRR